MFRNRSVFAILLISWAADGMFSQELIGIPGSHILEEQSRQLANLNAVAGAPTPFRKQSAWSFSVGTTKNWWATDLRNNTEYVVNSTCRAVGSQCYVFVEDSMWTIRVTQAAVDAIVKAFDVQTPADSVKGIYQLDVEYFGNPPDVDADPKIIILVLNILDSAPPGSYVAGYFNSLNEYRDPQGSHRSNEAEIYYLDANPANLTSPSSFNTACSVTAHEFQHMIHFNYDRNEDSFVNEGMSESASKLCGYALRSPSSYYANTNVSFLSWGVTPSSSPNVLNDYSRTALFSWYLVEQFGGGLTKKVVAQTANGIAGYNSALDSVGSPLRFLDALKNFAAATSLNRITYDPRYGFVTSITTYPTPHQSYTSQDVPSTADTILPYGTKVYRFSGGDLLKFQYSSASPLAVQIIGTGAASAFVGTVPVQTEYTLTGYPATLSQATVVVTNLNSTQSALSYSATMRVPSSIIADNGGTMLPTHLELSANYPNPFNPSTTLRILVPIEEHVTIEVFDITGQRVDQLYNGTLSPGGHILTWEARSVPSGIYFIRASTPNESSLRRVALLR